MIASSQMMTNLNSMKISKYNIWTFLLLVLFSSSCRKYVEVDQFSTRTLTYTDDFQFVMNNRGTFENNYILPLVTNDDMATTDATHQATFGAEIKNAYLWAADFYSAGQTDVGWSNMYQQIYTCNEVLFSVMSSRNGTEVQKKSIYAEALAQRAFAYLMLANQYGEIYNPANAASQTGVPLLTKPDLFQPLNRASLKTIYDQVVNDLLEAIPALPNLGTNNGHASKASAYALLSRCYLYMRNFEQAGEYADKALQIRNTLNNLEDYVGKTSTFPRKLDDKELLLTRSSAGQFRSQLNPELISLFTTGDLRYELFTSANVSGVPGRAYIRGNFTFEGIYTGLNVPELILNRAEVYARAGNTVKTLELLNMLRQKRFKAANYTDLVITNADDLLPAVINERRREFMGTGLRWFDQRRLNLDPAFAKPVVRTLAGQTATLSPGSNRFIYPVALDLLTLNPEIQQSPR